MRLVIVGLGCSTVGLVAVAAAVGALGIRGVAAGLITREFRLLAICPGRRSSRCLAVAAELRAVGVVAVGVGRGALGGVFVFAQLQSFWLFICCSEYGILRFFALRLGLGSLGLHPVDPQLHSPRLCAFSVGRCVLGRFAVAAGFGAAGRGDVGCGGGEIGVLPFHLGLHWVRFLTVFAQLGTAGLGVLLLRRSLGCLAVGAGFRDFGVVAVPAGRSQDGVEFVGAELCADGGVDGFERICQVGCIYVHISTTSPGLFAFNL